MRLAFLLVLAAAGCNSILGVGDVHLSPDGHGADAAGDAPSDRLTGTSVITYVEADGTTAMKNEDLTHYKIGAYYLDGSGTTYQHIVGTGTADGTFTVIGVPDNASTILLELTPYDGMPELFAVHTRVLDASWMTAGRPDAVPTKYPTHVALNVTGMSPWQDDDGLQAISYSTATFAYLSGGSTRPASGATSVTGTFDWMSAMDYMSGEAPRLVQASAGDDFYLEHARYEYIADQQGNPVEVYHLVDLFQGSGVDMTDGAPVTVSGAFTPLSANQPQTVTLPISQDRALAAEDGQYIAESYTCTHTLTPFTVSGVAPNEGFAGPPVWSASATIGRVSSVTASGAYAYPFPDTWTSELSCSYAQRRLLQLPGGEVVFDGPVETVNAPATSNFVAAPMIGSPTNAKIDGKPLLTGGTIHFDGSAPVSVEWEPVPGAAYYVLTVRLQYSYQNRGESDAVVNIGTPDVAVEIPAAVFKEGSFYTVDITAEYTTDGTAFANGQLRRTDPTSGSTSIASGLFLFSSKCGNNVVDTGEQCDADGDSATCDADCSNRTCGDGYTNPAAGELCDNGGDSETCDRDCTKPACGDGLVNVPAGEACDDHNTTSGDGCSATCQVETGWTCTGSPSTCTMSLMAPRRRGRQHLPRSAAARRRR